MKARYTTQSGRLTFEVEAETVKAIFPLLASIQETFDAEHECGMCGSGDIRMQLRRVEKFDYYELKCNQCRARFQFGQAMEGGTLFPKRRDADGNALDHGGWSRWQPEGERQAPPVQPANGNVRPMQRAAVPRAVGDAIGATPEGLQPSFDKLGILLNKVAPTRVGPALDMLRDHMNEVAGAAGRAEFDRIYRGWEDAKLDRTTASAYKELFRALVNALDRLSLGVNA